MQELGNFPEIPDFTHVDHAPPDGKCLARVWPLGNSSHCLQGSAIIAFSDHAALPTLTALLDHPNQRG